ncbi:MAG: membrane protein insertase YidC [Gammaproteobacteria bacterium]|jgi:YidC/Oxa1 family membrane protein insertase|nr:membrane protein insertase YidC [Gammaproteobacteria bacterium]
MDNQRLLIWATFGLLLWMTYQAWVQDYGPPTAASQPTTADEQLAPLGDAPGLPALPAESVDTPQLADNAPALDIAAQSEPEQLAPIIRVQTDVLELEISTIGGTLQRATMRQYPVAKDQPDVLMELLSPGQAELGMIQTGLNSAGDRAKANHTAQFQAAATDYVLGNADELLVPLTWTDGQGVTVEKTLRFTRGSYRIDITQRLINDSDIDWRGAVYAQLLRRSRDAERSMFDVDTYSFDGPIIYDGEKSEKLKRDDLLSDGPYSVQSANGWLGAIEHHFLSAIVPPADEQFVYNVSARGDVSLASLIGTPSVIVGPGETHAFETTVFVGPKLQAQLEEIAESLKLSVDYGWLTIISQPLFWLLSFVYSFVGNWGVAIITVTILIKAAFYKLTEASGRSMAKMREIQPRMKALQDRYKDDRQALSQAMMELYKREKVNPAAGCLPILIQMPFFLAFYWVLLESVEMRQAPFALWITDLSSKDPYFILPIIMGVAMLFQQKLNPTPGDPVQAKVMQIMPIMFTVFFAFFPSGLVLYWVTNTGLSIAQQWYINKVVHEEAAARKGKKKDKS